MHSQLNSPMQTSNIVSTISARVIGEKFKSLGTLLNMETIPISRDRSEKFSALDFLPVYHIGKAFDILYEELIEDDRFENFLTYFENNYIGRRNRDGERGRP